MRTKWFKYPKEIPHETGFYTVRGINEEDTNFEEDEDKLDLGGL